MVCKGLFTIISDLDYSQFKSSAAEQQQGRAWALEGHEKGCWLQY